MKVLLVYNPSAGGGKAAQKLESVKKLFTDSGIDFEFVLTKYKSHATEIVSKSNLGLYDGIAAAGGDGTFFEVLNGYFRNKERTEIPLGVLPVGTGN